MPFVVRLRAGSGPAEWSDAVLVETHDDTSVFAGQAGLLAVEGVKAEALDGDVVLVQPLEHRLERLLRKGSEHNTLLVTERCDQLCVMCSQPPKKTHVDRFDLLEQACRLADNDVVIGITGGEPTLYKEQLLGLIERVLEARPDLQFHVLTNGQHFEESDVARLRDPRFRSVTWGIPLYAARAELHDEIVGKAGAHVRLRESFAHLLMAGARIELRTVLVANNLDALPALARQITTCLLYTSPSPRDRQKSRMPSSA